MSANSNGSMCNVQCVCILGPNMHATKHEICNIRTATSATYNIWFLGYNIQHTTYCNIPHVDHAGTRGSYHAVLRAIDPHQARLPWAFPWRARTQRPHGGRLHPHPPLRGFMFLCPLSRALTRANQGPYTPFIHPRPTLTQVCHFRCGQPPHQSGCTVRLLQCCGTGFNYSPPRSRNLGGREHAWA